MSFITFLEENLLSCSFQSNLGIECLGCGMQRSVILLLKGQFIEAFYMYPAIYTIIAMFGYLLAHIKMNFKNGHKIILSLFVMNIVIMITNYLLNHL